MNEEFAIKLKTVIDQSSMEKARQSVSDLADNLKSQLSSLKITFSSAPAKTVEKVKAEIVDTTKSVEDLKRELADLQNAPLKWISTEGMSPQNAASAQKSTMMYVQERIAAIEELERKIQEAEAMATSAPEANILPTPQEAQETANTFSIINKTTLKIKNNFKDAFKSVLKTGMALLGVRTIYSAIRKSMSAYLAQNEELQAKLNGCWYALGSLFAPVLEWIIDKFVYLVSLVDAFVRSLGFAGVNMSKYGKAAGKAAKESKQLAGFDELNNLNENDSSGGGGGSGMNLKPVSDEALSAFKSILALVGAIGAGIAAWKAASALNDLFGWGLNPTQLAGIGVAVGGIVLAISSLLNYLKDPTWLNFGGIITGIGATIAGVGMIIGSTPVIVAGVVVAILGILAAFWPQISGFLDKCIAGVDSAIEWIHQNLTTKFGVIGTLIGAWIETVLTIIKGFITTAKEFLDDLFNGVRSILDGIISIFRGDFKGGITQILNGIAQLIRGSLNTIRNLVDTLFNAIKTLVGNLFSWVSSKTSNSIRNIINNFIINPINKVIGWINSALNFSTNGISILGKEIVPAFSLNLGTLRNIPTLDVGTNYVPNDMLAQIHKGEAVLPKAFNEDQFANTEETNELLRVLIEAVESKNFDVSLDGRSLTRTVTRYQHDMARELGGA